MYMKYWKKLKHRASMMGVSWRYKSHIIQYWKRWNTKLVAKYKFILLRKSDETEWKSQKICAGIWHCTSSFWKNPCNIDHRTPILNDHLLALFFFTLSSCIIAVWEVNNYFSSEKISNCTFKLISAKGGKQITRPTIKMRSVTQVKSQKFGSLNTYTESLLWLNMPTVLRPFEQSKSTCWRTWD